MVKGTIVKGVGGFYYVETDKGIYECRARGIFREDNIIPMIGDRVTIRISGEDNTGYIEEIEERKSHLIRPPVANVTQAIIVMSIKEPDVNLWLLDRFIVMAEHQNLNISICINKIDLALQKELDEIVDIYQNIGYTIIRTSAETDEGIESLKRALMDNVTVFAGPSGVGKSSLLNRVHPGLELETGDISQKTTRGKHTTRHVELFKIEKGSYVLDTPGFSALSLEFIETEYELDRYFIEINRHSGGCKFINCLHSKEPGCAIKDQLNKGNIDGQRYSNYLKFLEEIKGIQRF